ncbi:uncharacterized protein EMH_0087070 [Eimeria mitis]|uniref:Uncharacterized protein n=1 Tax=Eimeria mitis TaxID=44415 RepID=U6KEW8_9EIME|nr:uncharacterized protein EMH_0087070 [Eimeria mitis]CDJ36479.1 hypothetical protein EMH_0087070 [Eimeria mitis]
MMLVVRTVEGSCADSQWASLAAPLSADASKDQTTPVAAVVVAAAAAAAAAADAAAAVEGKRQGAAAKQERKGESSSCPQGKGEEEIPVRGSDVRLHSDSSRGGDRSSNSSSVGISSSVSSRSGCARSRSSSGGASCSWGSGDSEGLGFEGDGVDNDQGVCASQSPGGGSVQQQIADSHTERLN